MKYLLPFAFFSVLPFMAIAQDAEFHCAADDLGRMVKLHHNDPVQLAAIEASRQELEHWTQHWAGDAERGGEPYVIPLVFHIIHNNGSENISDAQVEDAVRILNDDFNRLNEDWDDVREEFLGIVADVGVNFRLAKLDPDGNCTNGITRTVSERTNDGDQDMKELIQWPRDRYLNIWVAASADGAAGYTYTPGSVDNWPQADGIVILHTYTGSIGTSSPGHSRALSHEVGHWINLRHTWGGTNSPGLAENCGSSDNVSDTPPTIGWTTCNLNGATCGSDLDNVENYMEYAYCQKMFTEGQKSRMLAALTSGTSDRSNLWSVANLLETGVSTEPELCSAQLTSDRRLVCTGEAVQFVDVSYNGVTQWEWTFEGGTPSTSTEEDPLVTYDTPGVYGVSLVVGNGSETMATSQQAYVQVLSLQGTPLPFNEDVEAVSVLPNSTWTVSNPEQDNGFELSTAAAYSGTHSFRMRNFGSEEDRLDALVSNTIDVTNDSLPIISFRYAYVQRNNSNDDMLRLYISRDCGQNWSMRRQLRGTLTMPTAADQNTVFVPNSAAQWGYQEVGNIAGSDIVTDFRIKFEFKSDGGNDLWLDDININGIPVGFGELTADAFSAQVLPNPATDEATLLLNLPVSGALRIELLDPTGRTVRVVANEQRAIGDRRWQLPLEGLGSGVYLVRIQQDEAVRVLRLTKQ